MYKSVFFFSLSLVRLELQKASKSMSFYYRDSLAFVDAKSVFLELTYTCDDGSGTPLTYTDNVSTTNPGCHTIIDSVELNIGECNISKNDKAYPLYAKLMYENNDTHLSG